MERLVKRDTITIFGKEMDHVVRDFFYIGDNDDVFAVSSHSFCGIMNHLL